MTPEQLEFCREDERRAIAALTPERLNFWQQQDIEQHRSTRDELTPEQLEFRREGERRARDELTTEGLEF